MEFRDNETLFWNCTKVNFAPDGAAFDRTKIKSNNAGIGLYTSSSFALQHSPERSQ
jgi:hypothetical protein